VLVGLWIVAEFFILLSMEIFWPGHLSKPIKYSYLINNPRSLEHMTQFTNLLISAIIILTGLAIVWWFCFSPKPESFCNGKWNPDMYLPVTGPLRFPFPERRLQAWYLPEAYWGDKPRFDYAFREDSDGKLTPVWPNVPIKPRMTPAEY
jgi:hypothetical protein